MWLDTKHDGIIIMTKTFNKRFHDLVNHSHKHFQVTVLYQQYNSQIYCKKETEMIVTDIMYAQAYECVILYVCCVYLYRVTKGDEVRLENDYISKH